MVNFQVFGIEYTKKHGEMSFLSHFSQILSFVHSFGKIFSYLHDQTHIRLKNTSVLCTPLRRLGFLLRNQHEFQQPFLFNNLFLTFRSSIYLPIFQKRQRPDERGNLFHDKGSLTTFQPSEKFQLSLRRDRVADFC